MAERDEIRFRQIAGSGGAVYGLSEDGRVWAFYPQEGVWKLLPMKIKV
jgi:hypothetical protein